MLGGKLKFLIPLLKLGKVGGTIWSMLLMIAAYAIMFPWTFSIGIVIMIFIHEMGHIFAAKRKGLPVSAPAFIPFLGALITMKKQPTNAETEAYLAYGGPLIGTLGALLTLGLAVLTQYEVLFAIAQVGFFLNLVNMLPIHPLDGGRIVTAISRWLWVVGLIGGLIFILYLGSILFLLIWLLFAWELYNKYIRKNRDNPYTQMPYTLSIDRVQFESSFLMLPGEYHKRELPILRYCRLADQVQLCAVAYPGFGKIGEIPMENGLVEKVELVGTRATANHIDFKLAVTLFVYPEFRQGAIREEQYYQVPPSTRLKYGLAYFGLAALLLWFLVMTAGLAPMPVIVG